MWGFNISGYTIKDIAVYRVSEHYETLGVAIQLEVDYKSLKHTKKDYEFKIRLRTDTVSLFGWNQAYNSKHSNKAEFIIKEFERKSRWARTIMERELKDNLDYIDRMVKERMLMDKYKR